MRFKKLIEATITKGYPDTGGIASDDDYPPGNIIIGPKYKKIYVEQPKTGVKIVKYIEVDDFMWDEFDGCVGMHRMSNYDKTLLTMIPVYGDRMFKHMRWTDTKGFDTDPENIARKKISHVDQRRGFGRNDVNKKEYKTTKAKDITEMVDKYIK